MTRSTRSARPAAFTDAEVGAGFWLVLAHVLGVDAPSHRGWRDDEGARATPSRTRPDVGAPPPGEDSPRVRAAIAAARSQVLADPSLTLSVADHDRARLEVLAALGRVSTRGSALWPVGSRTVSTRLGGGSWSGALARLGLATPVAVHPRGNRRFDEDDYNRALRDFLEECSRTGATPSFLAYRSWCAGQRRQGRGRPAGATLRQHFGSWSRALEAVGGD